MTLEECNSEGVALTSAFISSLDDAASFCHSFRLFMASSVSSNFSFLSETIPKSQSSNTNPLAANAGSVADKSIVVITANGITFFIFFFPIHVPLFPQTLD